MPEIEVKTVTALDLKPPSYRNGYRAGEIARNSYTNEELAARENKLRPGDHFGHGFIDGARSRRAVD